MHRQDNACEFVDATKFYAMGYSLRTRDWRYVEWVRWLPELKPDWTRVVGQELYNHTSDDGTDFNWEGESVAAGNPAVVASLSATLHALVANVTRPFPSP